METRAGKMRDRIRFDVLTPAVGDGGQPQGTWGTHATVWGDFDMEEMAEKEDKARPLAITTATVKVRYLSTLNNKMRMVYDGRTFEITGMTYDKRKRWQVIKGKEQL